MNISIKEIADRVGGVVALSKSLGLSRGAVSQWDRVPIERVVAVEKLTGIPRAELRPDVFGLPETPIEAQQKEAA
jgi:DNA-binding transcriptional regulator YdaS (Cro superfamily)